MYGILRALVDVIGMRLQRMDLDVGDYKRISQGHCSHVKIQRTGPDCSLPQHVCGYLKQLCAKPAMAQAGKASDDGHSVRGDVICQLQLGAMQDVGGLLEQLDVFIFEKQTRRNSGKVDVIFAQNTHEAANAILNCRDPLSKNLSTVEGA
jgi:hypothetical protein